MSEIDWDAKNQDASTVVFAKIEKGTTNLTHYDRNVRRHRQNFRAINDLLFQQRARNVQKVGKDRVDDEVLVGADFVATKGGNAVNQETCRLLEIPGQQIGQGAVDLEPITTIPITTGTFGRQFVGLQIGSKELKHSE